MKIKKLLVASTVLATMIAPTSSVVFAEESYENTEEVIIISAPVDTISTKISFSDVPTSHWAYNSITNLVDLGYVSGYPNGTYGIEKEVTRGEAASIIARWMRGTGKIVEKETYNNPFADVPSTYWASKDILEVVDAGYMSGKGNGKFEPLATVTRAEMATILVNVLDVEKKADYQFHDVASTYWASEYIKTAYSHGLVNGVGNYKFNPTGKVTRAQYAVFINNGINWKADFVAEPIPEKPVVVVPVSNDNPDAVYGKDVNNVFTVDNDVYVSDTTWARMMENKYLKAAYSDTAQKVLVNVNKKYGTNYQYTSTQGEFFFTNLNDSEEREFSILENYSLEGGDGCIFRIDFAEPVQVEIMKSFLNVMDSAMYSKMSSRINEVISQGNYFRTLDELNGYEKKFTDINGYEYISLSVYSSKNLGYGSFTIVLDPK